MELFLKIVAPVQSYDFQTFFHNLLLSLPASALLGLLLFFILGAFSSLKSKEQRLYIVIATTIVISFTAAFYNLGVPTETLFACLLYTSPSPRDGLLSRMPSSA